MTTKLTVVKPQCAGYVANPRTRRHRQCGIGSLPRRRSSGRARYGLSLQFESSPDDAELGRLVDSTIWVNRAHPAFTRASGSPVLAQGPTPTR